MLVKIDDTFGNREVAGRGDLVQEVQDKLQDLGSQRGHIFDKFAHFIA